MKKFVSLIMIAVMLLGLAACGGEKAAEKNVDLAALYESYGEYMPDMFQADEDTMLNFMGIESADCAQAVVYICGDGMRADEVWLIEAVDEDALARVEELAQTRIQAKLDETESYAPDQFVIVQDAQLLTSGNYLALLISPDVDALKTGFEAAMQ